VATVDQLQLAVPTELGQHRGDEVLLAKPWPDAAVQLGGQLYQARLCGGRAEAGQRLRGQRHRVQALAFDVADQHAKSLAGHGHVVEVAANQGVLAGRQVAHGQRYPA
jgi:hypothetical protein